MEDGDEEDDVWVESPSPARVEDDLEADSSEPRKTHGSTRASISFLNSVVIPQSTFDPESADAVALRESRASRLRSSRRIAVEGVSNWEAYCMIMNIYVGFGIVAIPKAVAPGGWMSPLIIPVMGFLAWLTAQQITSRSLSPA